MAAKKPLKAKKAPAKKATKLTAKQEKFAQVHASGKTQADAYRAAFDVKPTTKAETIQQSASRLMANPMVAARVATLREVVVKKTRITLESHLDDLMKLRNAASKKGQYSAAISAEVARGKASGVHVERTHHSGAIGTYDLANLTDEQLAALESILGPLAHAGGDPGGEGEAES